MVFDSFGIPVKGRITRGLRFRLTLTYVVLFIVMLGFLGVFFRQTLKAIYGAQVHHVLEEEWAAVKAYLRIDKGKVEWYSDPEDPEEALIVNRLKQVYMLTDARGKIIEISPRYKAIMTETPAEIRAVLNAQKPHWREAKDDQGNEYLVRSGTFIDDNHRPFYVALGRSFADRNRVVDEFTQTYSIILPVMILGSLLLGWFMAGRALAPVNDVARTAQRITSSNLTSEIPLRGANDELDRLIEAFNRMIERLDAAFTQTKQFSTDVSHELRTPLTAIRGQLEVALFAAQTTEQYRDAIVEALEDVERLSQTIRALLLLSQAESGQLVLQRQVLNFSDMITELVDEFQIPAESSKIELSASVAPDVFIDADKVQMERLISNLLSNAIKYTPEGGRVAVSLIPHSGHIELAVADTGVGIPSDSMPHIFDRFYRVPSIERGHGNPERGLGLGLSFVAWIVKVHGGRIDVQSQVGKGTRFTVALPIGKIHHPAAQPAPFDAGAATPAQTEG